MDLADRTVLITGASSGIGAATAVAVARRGGRPILVARRQEQLDSLVADIGEAARAYAVDCGDREAVAAAARRIEHELGVPDAIVNNAGAGRLLFFDETPPDEFEQMMAVPYFAAVYVTRAFLPAMIGRGSGHVVVVNSPVSFVTWRGAAGYGAARWALRGLTDALRADLSGTGIGVSHVVPAQVATGYFEHNPGAERGIPAISRFVGTLTPEHVADVIVDAIERERRQVFTPFRLRLLVTMSRLFPGLSERIVLATGRRRPSAADEA
jgi:short-subunit dehydrogenase